MSAAAYFVQSICDCSSVCTLQINIILLAHTARNREHRVLLVKIHFLHLNVMLLPFN